MNTFVERVNELLKAGEPGNIKEDTHKNPSQTGYKPQAIIDAMNEVLWGQWGFDEVSSELTGGDDKPVMAVAQVRVWLKDIEFRPVGWGQGRITQGDIGDARKSAQTDAIKKALSYFSIGNRAYHGLLDAKKSAPSNGHAPAVQPQGQKLSALEQAIAQVKREFEEQYPEFVKGNPDWFAHFQRTALGDVPASLTSTHVAKMRGYLAEKRKKQPAKAS